MAAREARCPKQKGRGRADFVFYIMMRREIQVSVGMGWLIGVICLHSAQHLSSEEFA